jgi:hypothetical protein
MGMILALEHCERDLTKTMRLARLLADLEPMYRTDLLLGLVCQPGTPRPHLVDETIEHCSKKFQVEHVVSKYGAPGWADGSGQLWRGTVSHFYDAWKRGKINHRSIATFDGGDGVPLHNNWLDLLVAEHEITRRAGKLVSGLLNLDVPEHTHINGNMILELELLEKNPSVRDTPLGASPAEWYKCWDTYHAKTFMSNARPSTVVHNCWNRRGVTKHIMDEAATSSVWLHGYKDDRLHDVTRERLLVDLGGRPSYPRMRSQDDLLKQHLEIS